MFSYWSKRGLSHGDNYVADSNRSNNKNSDNNNSGNSGSNQSDNNQSEKTDYRNQSDNHKADNNNHVVYNQSGIKNCDNNHCENIHCDNNQRVDDHVANNKIDSNHNDNNMLPATTSPTTTPDTVKGRKSLSPSSQRSLLEFQDFLRRVRTLKMSPATSATDEEEQHSHHQQQQEPHLLYATNQNIEYGIEPTGMDCDDSEATDSFAIATDAAALQQQVDAQYVASAPVASTTNIRVTVGIDKDLEMILEMDPSIVDLGDISVTESLAAQKVMGLPPLSGGPTFKTVTTTSRTQLKLQLQREQQQQELERRDAEKRATAEAEDASLQQQMEYAFGEQQILPQLNTMMAMQMITDSDAPNSATHNVGPTCSESAMPAAQHSHLSTSGSNSSSPMAMKVPMQSIGVDVPPQVLQVRTVLENPTRYHVIQKQKNQVRQFLSESFKQTVWDRAQPFSQNKSSSSCVSANQLSRNNSFSMGNMNHSPCHMQSSSNSGKTSADSAKHETSIPSLNASGGDCSSGQFSTFNDFQQCYGGGSSHYKSSIGKSAIIASNTSAGQSNGSRSGGLVNFMRNGGGVVNQNSSLTSTPMSPSLSSVATSNSEVSDLGSLLGSI